MNQKDYFHFHPDDPDTPVRIFTIRPGTDDGWREADGRRWFVIEDREIECVLCSGQGCNGCDHRGRFWCVHDQMTSCECVYCSAPVTYCWES